MASVFDDDDLDPPEQIFVGSEDGGVFAFDGQVLRFRDHAYATDVAQYMPLLQLEPLRTKKGTVAARPLRHDSKPLSWWQSQCVFRGFKSSGSIEDLQKALRGHEDDPMSDEMLELRDRARDLLEAKIKEREENWLHDMSNDEKAMKDPRRFLKEEFPPGSSDSEKTVLLSTPFVANIQYTAEELGLGCEYTFAPTDGDAVVRMVKYWVVIGRDRRTVTQEIRMIERETQRLKREQEEGRQDLRRKNKYMRTNQLETEEAVAKSEDWDVIGLWNITCPQIEAGWGVRNLTMKIYMEKTEKGSRLFAEFDFCALTGVLRFEKKKYDAILPLKRSQPHNDNVVKEEEENNEVERQQEPVYNDDEASEKSSDTYDEYEADDEEKQDQNDQRNPSPEDFHFTCHPQPSTHPECNYHYRGEVISEEVVDEAPDTTLYGITICGFPGKTLKGDIESAAFGVSTFTGVKAGEIETARCDVKEDRGKCDVKRAYEVLSPEL
ncbi:uncharacterized protein RSE6_16110 [Rhynchosporium secalis]|uniref:Uncharacterized protein n=1 Tax=Rhynchosporium secalis TaxID=38038 RepID=A0A1E1MNV9_RHYSE|nr:uncharacterized protein RSE6_16110 [Rhynchosporium secalis]